MNTNNLIEHSEKQQIVLHQHNLKRLENYLSEYFYSYGGPSSREHRHSWLKINSSFEDNTVDYLLEEVFVLAYQLISNELEYVCMNGIDVPEALTLQDNLNRGSQHQRGFDMSTTKKYDVRNYTQLNKITNIKEADMD